MNARELNLITMLLVIAIAVTDIASDIYVPSLPVLVDYFHVSEQMISLSLSMGLLGFCLSAPLYGPLSDSYGRRVVMLTGMLIFTFGSLLCFLSPSALIFVVARLIQGIGVAVAYVVGIAVVKDLYSQEKFAKIMSTIHMVVALAPAVAPIIGGYIASYFSWRINFLLLSCIAGIVVIWMRYMPETLPRSERKAFALNQVLKNYLIIVSNPIFTGYAMISGIIFAGLWVYLSEIPFVFKHLGLDIVDFSYYQAPIIGVYALGTYINSKTVEYYGVDRLLSISLFICLSGALLLMLVAIYLPESSTAICITMSVFSGGMGGVFANAATRSMEVFKDMKGAASAALGCIECLMPAGILCVLTIFHDGTVIPAAVGILLAAAGAFVLHIIVNRFRTREDKRPYII